MGGTFAFFSRSFSQFTLFPLSRNRLMLLQSTSSPFSFLLHGSSTKLNQSLWRQTSELKKNHSSCQAKNSDCNQVMIIIARSLSYLRRIQSFMFLCFSLNRDQTETCDFRNKAFWKGYEVRLWRAQVTHEDRHVRRCLHIVGTTFLPVRIHPSSLLWICIRLHDTTAKVVSVRDTPVATPDTSR